MLGRKNKMEKGTFMAYACTCNCWCVCTCNNCRTVPQETGTQMAQEAQKSTTYSKSWGTLLLLS